MALSRLSYECMSVHATACHVSFSEVCNGHVILNVINECSELLQLIIAFVGMWLQSCVLLGLLVQLQAERSQLQDFIAQRWHELPVES